MTLKQITFGASCGYLSGTDDKSVALRNLYLQGNTHRRVYGIFNKGFDDTIDKIKEALVKYLAPDAHGVPTCQLLICLDGLPHSWLRSDLSGLNDKQRELSKFCNRFSPKDSDEWNRWDDLLIRLREAMKPYWDYISWEFFQEPDSTNFFWGDRSEFNAMILSYLSVFRSTGCKMYIGDFTSSLFRDPNYKNKRSWWNWIIETSQYNEFNAGFSSSFYEHDSGGQFDYNDNSYPTRFLSNPVPSIVSEFNAYSWFKKGSEQEQDFLNNYGVYLIKFLMWIYPKNIGIFYLHPLLDSVITGSMGLLTKTGNSYAAKSPCYAQMLAIFNVVRDGYTLLPDGVKGVSKSVVLDGNSFTIVNN